MIKVPLTPIPDSDLGRREHGFERHMQTLAVALTLGTIAWTGSTLWSMRDTMTRLEERVASLQTLVREGADDRFRGSDWRRERERLDERFNGLANRVDKIERGAARR